jgi:hypothetical protein
MHSLYTLGLPGPQEPTLREINGAIISVLCRIDASVLIGLEVHSFRII